METSLEPAKEKRSTNNRRNNEKRKEQSRDAARCRRSQENAVFTALSEVLPISPTIMSYLDKATIMRLVISHLRTRHFFTKASIKCNESNSDEYFNSLQLRALEGIILVLSTDGEIVQVSGNVPAYLGVYQVDLLGHSIYDVCHPCDHNDIKDLLSGKNFSEGLLSIFIRFKCTGNVSKGRHSNLKATSYKVLHVTGHFTNDDEEKTDDEKDNIKNHFRFMTFAHPIPHPGDIQIPLGTFTFLSKHSLDMKFTYADDRMTGFLGYNPDNLIGKSFYNYHHAQDNCDIQKAFKSLFTKGQSETGQYRFLAQSGGYAWVSTQATVIYCDKGTKPESIVCVNYMISEKLNEIEVYSYDQLEWNRKLKAKKKGKKEKLIEKLAIVEPEIEARPQPATKKIFAPRTKDMNTSFLMFSDDESAMKDEPDDLTHLAPVAGDVCIPLSNYPLLDDVMNFFPENCSPLINEDASGPLFSSYRDEGSSGSLSPPLTASPESLPSLCSFDDSHFEDPSLKSFLDIDLGDPDNDDICTRAPYISMSEADDLPLLLPSEFLWNANLQLESESEGSSTRCSPLPMDTQPDKDFSSLSHLLHVDKKDTLNTYPDQGGGLASAGDNEGRKRNASLAMDSPKKRKLTIPDLSQGGGSSVLMNLLVAGQDVNAGYICVSPRKNGLNSDTKKKA